MKILALALGVGAALIAAGVSTRGGTPNDPVIAAHAALIARDLRLATVGYHLAKGSAHYCARTSRNPGWVLHDVAQYQDEAQARRAFVFREPVAVAAVVRGGPAERAGIGAGDGLVARGGAGWDWQATTPARFSAARIDAVRDELRALFDRDGAAMLQLAGETGLRRVHFAPEPVCRSDFWVDTRERRDAGADGERVRVTVGMIDYVLDDDELAAVVAHEMAHNLLDHRARIDAVRRGRTAVVKATEAEADRLSVWLMANAGFDPEAAISFWQRYGKATSLGLFSAPTHYRWQSRVAMLREEIERMRAIPVENGRRDPPLLAARRNAR